jgi:hypothetical protein
VSTFDRLAYLATRDERAAARPSGPTLAAALADRAVALVRIRSRCDARFKPYRDLVAFTAEYRRVWFDAEDYDADKAIRAGLIAWYMDLHPTVDWRQDHQLVLATGKVQSAPEAWEDGFLPEDDFSFGGSPAMYVPCGTFAEQPADTFPFPPLAQIGA